MSTDEETLLKDARIFAKFRGKTLKQLKRVPTDDDSDTDTLILEFTDGSRLVFKSSDGSGYKSAINLDESLNIQII